MKNSSLSHFAIIGSFLCLTPLEAQTTAPTSEAKWVCTAATMVGSRYSGGDWAFIHLGAYQNGGSYKIIDKSDSVAKGVTKDGTPFECKKVS